MALRLAEGVVRGVIDNTRRGTVTGEVWLAGRDEPLRLTLAGDCLRDLAGCRCTFVNPKPEPLEREGVATDQTGEVGDLTASRKVRVPVGPVEEFCERKRQGLPVKERRGNALYLEWFSDRNGRVVIEAVDFVVTVSPHDWTMTADEERRQQGLNADALRRFLDRIEAALQPPRRAKVSEDRDLDEHEWELFLKESDARAERYGELLDKHRDHPDADTIVAREMGWTKLADALRNEPSAGPADTDADAGWDVPEFEDEEEAPDPALEGKTWVRTKNGYLTHPLPHRCQELGIRLFHDGKALEQDGRLTDDFREFTFKIQCTSAKLAGALNSISRGFPFDSGFMAATIKRALALLNEALGALARVEAGGLIPEKTAAYREEAFAIRAAMLEALEAARRGDLPGSV